MASVAVRYFTMRPGARGPRYFWQPSKALQAAGWKLQRLPDDFDAAVRAAETINRAVDESRGSSGKRITRRKPTRWVRERAVPAPAVTVDPVSGAIGVYLILRQDGIVKIGISRNPKKRLKNFRDNSPDPLRLVAFKIIDGAAAVEAALHAAFADRRIAGEWFKIPIEEAQRALWARLPG